MQKTITRREATKILGTGIAAGAIVLAFPGCVSLSDVGSSAADDVNASDDVQGNEPAESEDKNVAASGQDENVVQTREQKIAAGFTTYFNDKNQLLFVDGTPALPDLGQQYQPVGILSDDGKLVIVAWATVKHADNWDDKWGGDLIKQVHVGISDEKGNILKEISDTLLKYKDNATDAKNGSDYLYYAEDGSHFSNGCAVAVSMTSSNIPVIINASGDIIFSPDDMAAGGKLEKYAGYELIRGKKAANTAYGFDDWTTAQGRVLLQCCVQAGLRDPVPDKLALLDLKNGQVVADYQGQGGNYVPIKGGNMYIIDSWGNAKFNDSYLLGEDPTRNGTTKAVMDWSGNVVFDPSQLGNDDENWYDIVNLSYDAGTALVSYTKTYSSGKKQGEGIYDFVNARWVFEPEPGSSYSGFRQGLALKDGVDGQPRKLVDQEGATAYENVDTVEPYAGNWLLITMTATDQAKKVFFNIKTKEAYEVGSVSKGADNLYYDKLAELAGLDDSEDETEGN